MSKFKRLAIIVAASGCAFALLAASTGGETEPAPKPAPKPAARPAEKLDPRLLKLIPDHCLGFVAVRNAEGFGGRVDAFIKQVLPPAVVPADFKSLDMIKGGAELGDGFNPKGSFALVMLHPKQYTPDMLKPPAEDEDGWDIEPTELPIAFIIPGKSAATMFPSEKPEKDGKYLKYGGGKGWAFDTDGFVIVSFKKKVIEAFPPAKSVAGRLLPAHKVMLGRYGVFAWGDRKTCSKLGKTRFALFMGHVASLGGGPVMAGGMGFPITYMGMTRGTVLKEATHVAVGIDMDKSGALFEVRWSYPADSLVGKVLAAFPMKPGPLMTRLPDLPYIFAYGATKQLKTPNKLKAEQYAKLLGSKYLAKVPEDVKAKAKAIILGLQDEVTSVQHYYGPASKEGLPLGGIGVVECKSPAKLKKIIGQIPAVAQAIVRNFTTGEDDEDFMDGELKKISIKHYKGVETVGEVKVDAIEIDHPGIQEWPEQARNMMKIAYGDDKFRFLIAQADKKTLVITFGGGTKLMGEAIKGAKQKRNLEADATIKAALAKMPQRRSVVAVFSVANAFNTYMNAMRAIAPVPIPPMKLRCKTPLVGAVSVEKLDISFSGHIPTAPIKEVFQVMMGAMDAPPPPPPPPPAP